ncbi:MAG: hypothetical protein BWY44_00247 [Candidatus Omnitrophica bacterium ADurb.Bin292]|nr:MAG: hypothetical protein BWY44_00247 [Candidatus Omnitrophica bacterium ADurb.Bin292]
MIPGILSKTGFRRSDNTVTKLLSNRDFLNHGASLATVNFARRDGRINLSFDRFLGFLDRHESKTDRGRINVVFQKKRDQLDPGLHMTLAGSPKSAHGQAPVLLEINGVVHPLLAPRNLVAVGRKSIRKPFKIIVGDPDLLGCLLKIPDKSIEVMLETETIPDHIYGDRFLFDRFPLAPVRSRITQEPCAQTGLRGHFPVPHPNLRPELFKLPAGRFRGQNGLIQLASVNHGFRMGFDIL